MARIVATPVNPGWITSPQFKQKLTRKLMDSIEKEIAEKHPSGLAGAQSVIVRRAPPDSIEVEHFKYRSSNAIGAQDPVDAGIEAAMEKLPRTISRTRDAIDNNEPEQASPEALRDEKR